LLVLPYYQEGVRPSVQLPSLFVQIDSINVSSREIERGNDVNEKLLYNEILVDVKSASVAIDQVCFIAIVDILSRILMLHYIESSNQTIRHYC
jgi:hypothetical protein